MTDQERLNRFHHIPLELTQLHRAISAIPVVMHEQALEAALAGHLTVEARRLAVPSRDDARPATTGGCIGDPHVHVHCPDRLRLLAACVSLTGTIDSETPRADGDFHIRLHLDTAHSIYQVDDKTVATSHRWLIWNEPGTWAMPNGLPGVPYFLVTDGLTDAEFWAVANSAK